MKDIIINIIPEKCAGCQLCRLICSFTHEEVFNPSKSQIIVDFVGDGFKVRFTDDCAGCGACADYCLYGALVKKNGEADV